ncbi:MAG: MBL fold metallo-hydrolase [Rhizobiales bacterium]|nr:MBL fold metallo-hydrolase [Hyphomicrobiales bacterium]
MSTLKAMIVPVTPFQQNCAILWEEETKRGAVSDPGGDVDQILKAVEKSGVTIEKVLLTHGHIDHAGGAAELAERLGVRIEGPHTEDLFLLEDLPRSGAQYGMIGVRPVMPDRWLKEGDTVTVGGLAFDIFETPGHTPGSVVFFNRPNRFLLGGDVLFKGSVGRTDFPRGDHAALLASIRDKLFPLGDDVVFLPGHGQPGRIGEERLTNPFLT